MFGGFGVDGFRQCGCEVVICRFFFQPMFNVWSSVGFWVFSAISVEHMTMFNVPFRNSKNWKIIETSLFYTLNG